MARSILVVDNQPVIVEYLQNVLEGAGYEVETASDGLSALRILEHSHPDVLLSDLVMPNIDGSRLCRIVRRMPQHRNLYIIILSAIAAEEQVDLASLGANACVAKGPLNSMKRHVLEILGKATLDASKIERDHIYGLDEIFERSITKELLRSKHHTEVVLDNLSEGILEVTEDGYIIYANPASTSLIGRAEEQVLGTNVNSLSFRVDGVPTQNILSLIEQQELAPGATIFSNSRQLSIKILPVHENSRQTKIVLLSDITDRMEADRKIRMSLEEKDVLLKEVHHRVKNNLSMVASLITLQGNYLHDERDAAILEQLRNRINSISLVHQQLYKSGDLAHIDFASYVKELTDNLLTSMSSASRHINVQIAIQQQLVSINVAIPLGLIIAELFTNALKYAFEEEATGSIRIELAKHGSLNHLVVADDGRGIAEEIDIAKSKTLGFQIVQALALQLQGTLRRMKARGTAISIDFPES